MDLEESGAIVPLSVADKGSIPEEQKNRGKHRDGSPVPLCLPFQRGFREFTRYYGMLIDTLDYADQGEAIQDLRNGRVNGVLTIPPDFSRRVLAKDAPRVALIEDNTDNFVSATLVGATGSLMTSFEMPNSSSASSIAAISTVSG
jgi:hypothetical protein